MELDGFLDALAESDGQQALIDLFQREIEGFGYYAFDAFCVDPATLAAPLQPGNWAVASYDFEFLKQFVTKGLAAICPATMEAGRGLTPFELLEFLARQPHNSAVAYQLELTKALNISHAWLVPLSTVGALKAVTVYRQGHSPAVRERFLASRHDIHLRSAYFYEAIEACRPGLPDGMVPTTEIIAPLSRRELECLTWAADGKTNWEIAQILGVSENTVHFYMKNVLRKLGATTRSQAVAKAVGQGLVKK